VFFLLPSNSDTEIWKFLLLKQTFIINMKLNAKGSPLKSQLIHYLVQISNWVWIQSLLGLCADGFTPFDQSARPYSCWPVIVTPYNPPPKLCMMPPYMLLSLIILGPDCPKGNVDVYLQPLIDELQQLWTHGVVTYDASKRQKFSSLHMIH